MMAEVKSFCCLPLFMLVLVSGCAARLAPLPPSHGDAVLGERIAEGVAFEGRVWFRGTMASQDNLSGGLVSLSVTDESRQMHFQRGVLDIERSGHDLWVLRRPSLDSSEFVVSVWRKGRFEELAQFTSSEKDEPIALLSSAGAPTVLSHRMIRVLSAGNHEWHVVELKGGLRSGVQVSVASPANGDGIYVGINRGEWGGGLQRVDVQTGAVTNIERRDSKKLCSGPLNSDCDPVTGVIPDPQNKDCVLAAVGLVHLFISNGRILRVCGERVTPIFEQPATAGISGKIKMTEAFYGLAPAADGGFWAITWRTLYRFAADGQKESGYPLPKLRPVSGVYLSRELPGVIVVRTDVNWAVSTSGYTPLIIPLEIPPGPKAR